MKGGRTHGCHKAKRSPAGKNIKNAQAARKRRVAVREGKYYRIVVRPKKEFATKYHDLGEPGVVLFVGRNK